MEREQQQRSLADAAAVLQLTVSGYSRIETGDTGLTVQHMRRISQFLQRQPRSLWRVAETWAAALESQGWSEHARADRISGAEMLAAVLQGLEASPASPPATEGGV
jgi:transcriptional regulator with XRE-family HTH domain